MKLISIIKKFSIAFVLIFIVIIFCYSNEKIVKKQFMNGKYIDNSIIVILDSASSLRDSDYTMKDFGEIPCTDVKILNKYNHIRAKEEKDNVLKNIIKYDKKAVKYVNHKTIIELKVNNKSSDELMNYIEMLDNRGDVFYAGPNYLMGVSSTTPNDPYLTNSNNDAWWIDSIKLKDAWDITTGSANVSVAILDTGIDGDHPDLQMHINSELSRDFTIGVQDIENYQPINPSDPWGHGTKVAGIIGAKGNNALGMSGVAWDVNLISLRVSIADVPTFSYTAVALDYAEMMGVDLINVSLNWNRGSSYDNAIYQAFSGYSGLVVCSAGNGGDNIDVVNVYPGCITNFNNLLVVGGIDRNDELVYFSPNNTDNSNYGLNNVDIYAPGIDVYTTTNNADYALSGIGTSFAAPFVTGVAALIKSLDNTLSPTEIKNIILNNCDMISITANDEEQIVRKLNAYKALSSIGHVHAFTYQTYNNLTHKKICTCGKYTYENHVGVQKPGVLGTSCLYCNKKLDFGGGLGEGILSDNIIATSINGSYILSTGIIILDERDLIAYANGTLIFSEKGGEIE